MPKKSVPLNIYLLKKDGSAGDGFLTTGEFLADVQEGDGRKTIPHREHALSSLGTDVARLFIRVPVTSHTPDWINFLAPALIDQKSLADLQVASASALLVISTSDRQFALTFGHGRHMLNTRAIEERFGIRCVLNTVDHKSISSIDKQTFDGVPSLSRIQASRAARIDDYEMDIESELLRALVGRTQSAHANMLGTMVAGMDALRLHVPVDIKSLSSLLAYVLERSESSDYKTQTEPNRPAPFDWVDNLFEIRDQSRKDKLMATVWGRLVKKEFDNVWLSIPEIIDWNTVKGFAYKSDNKSQSTATTPSSRKIAESPAKQPTKDDTWDRIYDGDRVIYRTLDIETFVETLRTNASLSTINNRRIYVVYDNIPEIAYPAIKCIYAEVRTPKSMCILSAGSWYEVKPSFNNELDLFFENIDRFISTDFIEYNHKDEADYSKSVAKASPAKYAVLDRDLVSHKRARNLVEICDLFGEKSGKRRRDQFIHLKRGRGSSTLSHLFAQAQVSAELAHYEESFRTEVSKKLRKDKMSFSKVPWASSNYEVVVGIIDGSKHKTLNLPFFSKINLRNTCHTIEGWGFKVRLLHVPEAQAVLDARKAKAAKKRAAGKVASKTESVKKQMSRQAPSSTARHPSSLRTARRKAAKGR